MWTALLTGVMTLVSVAIGHILSHLSARYTAILDMQRSEADRREREANQDRERREKIRQERLEPYRELRRIAANITSGACMVGEADPEEKRQLLIEIRDLRRKAMTQLAMTNDEEIHDLFTKLVNAFGEWRDTGNPVQLMLMCQDLSDGVDRIIEGGRQYVIRDPSKLPEPVRKAELP